MSSYKPYNSSQGQGFVQDSFSSDAGSAKKIVNHSLRPVTIKQLLSVSQTQADGDFKIDGQDLGQVTFVGVVRNVNRQSTQHAFLIEDGTGAIDTKRFPSPDEDPEETSGIVEGSYVRVIGMLKQLNQRFSVNIHTIRLIHDFNEVTHHNLEVIFVHVSSTRSKVDGTGMSSISHSNFGSNSMAGVGSMGAVGGASSAPMNEDILQQIADMIQNHPDKMSGVHRQEIISRFAPLVGGGQTVNGVIKQMIMDGFLYTTADEDHLTTTY